MEEGKSIMHGGQLYFIPTTLGENLFEGNESRSVADKEQDADYWITYRPITQCQKSFQLEITTFKKALGKEFLDELRELVARHSAVLKS